MCNHWSSWCSVRIAPTSRMLLLACRLSVAGVDPKSIVCEFFRHGQCTKGFKCKFSHDLNVERKSAKIDLFTDQRNLEKEEVSPGGCVVRDGGEGQGVLLDRSWVCAQVCMVCCNICQPDCVCFVWQRDPCIFGRVQLQSITTRVVSTWTS